jgi:hypothetical protein
MGVMGRYCEVRSLAVSCRDDINLLNLVAQIYTSPGFSYRLQVKIIYMVRTF